MAKCPKCNASIPLDLSDQEKCSACNSDLVADFPTLSSAIVFIVLLVGTITQIAVVMIIAVIGAKNYPGFPICVPIGIVWLIMLIVLVRLYPWIINRIVPYRLK